LERNEAFFRDVNREISRLASQATVSDLQIVCECARVDCMKIVEIRIDRYEEVRRHPRRFIVVEGHELPEIERVVAVGPAYLVVEKLGAQG
jgi:hypothetical protein